MRLGAQDPSFLTSASTTLTLELGQMTLGSLGYPQGVTGKETRLQLKAESVRPSKDCDDHELSWGQGAREVTGMNPA